MRYVRSGAGRASGSDLVFQFAIRLQAAAYNLDLPADILRRGLRQTLFGPLDYY